MGSLVFVSSPQFSLFLPVITLLKAFVWLPGARAQLLSLPDCVRQGVLTPVALSLARDMPVNEILASEAFNFFDLVSVGCWVVMTLSFMFQNHNCFCFSYNQIGVPYVQDFLLTQIFMLIKPPRYLKHVPEVHRKFSRHSTEKIISAQNMTFY